MIAKKYWIPVALIVILISSLAITPYLPLELMCDTNNTEYKYHGVCMYGSGPGGLLLIAPVWCFIGLIIWSLIYSANWLFNKSKKRKK